MQKPRIGIPQGEELLAARYSIAASPKLHVAPNFSLAKLQNAAEECSRRGANGEPACGSRLNKTMVCKPVRAARSHGAPCAGWKLEGRVLLHQPRDEFFSLQITQSTSLTPADQLAEGVAAPSIDTRIYLIKGSVCSRGAQLLTG